MLHEYNKTIFDALHTSPTRSAYVISEIYPVKGMVNEFWFRVGTSVDVVTKTLMNALAPGVKIDIGGTEFQVTGIVLENPPPREGEYITLSPILLIDKNSGKSIVYDGQDYVKLLECAINTQIKNNLKEDGTIEVLAFEPKGVRRRKISNRVFLTQKGRMILKGEEKHLTFLLNHGIGRSPALGFGMIVPGVPLEQLIMQGFKTLSSGDERK